MASDGPRRRSAAVGLGLLPCSAWLVVGCGYPTHDSVMVSGNASAAEAQTQRPDGAPVLGLDPQPSLPQTDPSPGRGVAPSEGSAATADESAPESPIAWVGADSWPSVPEHRDGDITGRGRVFITPPLLGRGDALSPRGVPSR